MTPFPTRAQDALEVAEKEETEEEEAGLFRSIFFPMI